MSLILPILLIVVFGIIDFGWFIYSYATVYQAARNGAEVAAKAPPYPGRISDGAQPLDQRDMAIDIDPDQCVNEILEAARHGAVMFPDLDRHVSIAYPEYQIDPRNNQPIPFEDRRKIGYPIEVGIVYEVEPLTPLWSFLPAMNDDEPGANEGAMTISTVSRRTIEGFGRDPNNRQQSACVPAVN
jgi:hypothetical protein